MQPVIPLDKILERMREERQPERPALRLYAPEPSPNDPRDHEWPPRRIEEDEQPERGATIIDFTI